MPFHAYSQIVASNAGAITAVISGQSYSRLAEISEDFAMYRYKSLKFRLLNLNSPSSQNKISMSFISGICDSPPTTHVQNMESLYAQMGNVLYKNPNKWTVVPASVLSGYQPWYKTIAGSPDAADEQIGIFAFVADTDEEAITYEVCGVVEYKDPVSSAVTAEMQQLRAKLRQEARQKALEKKKEEILSVFQAPPPVTAPTAVPTASGKKK